MMKIAASLVKKLHEQTGAGLMDCKRALEKHNGDAERSVTYLREQGIAAAAKKSGRIAAEGLVSSYIHTGGRIGVLIEVNCETDFVAKTDDFKRLVADIAMQVAAMKPVCVQRDDLPQAELIKEREVLKKQALAEGKPEHVVEKMVEGRLQKYFKEVCLLDQVFVKDNDKTIEQLVKEHTARLGERIVVRRFERYELGEGLERKQENFAEEVRAQVEGE
ncbi:MAG: translation elongation factor Ts [Bacillota bacterium]|jgi:elongation factor Ts